LCTFQRWDGTSIEVELKIFADWRVEDMQLMFDLISSPELKTRGGVA
jgi:hypothetical protein